MLHYIYLFIYCVTKNYILFLEYKNYSFNHIVYYNIIKFALLIFIFEYVHQK